MVIGSFYCSVDKCDDSLVDEDVHHPSLIISKTQRGKKTNSISHSGIVNAHWNFRQADYPNLYKEIMKINWTELNSISDINIASGIFYDKLNNALNLHVPKTRRSRKICFPPWFTPVIIKKLKLKNTLHRKLKSTINETEIHSKFKKIRSEIKRDIDLEYKRYITNVEVNIKSNPSKFWSHVNNLSRHRGIPSQLSYSNKLLNKPDDIVNAFAEYFSSNYNNCTVNNADDFADYQMLNPIINLNTISESDVLNALKKIKPNMCSGHDNIPGFILTDCACILTPPLTILFNLRLASG